MEYISIKFQITKNYLKENLAFDIKMKLLFQLISFLLPLCTIGQSTDTNALFSGFDDRPRGNQGVRIAFYNCENLFDIEHDSLKDDKSFTADGLYHWDMRKYWEKQKNISKVISAIGGWEAVEMIGLVEIENKHVLLNLINNTNIKNSNYRIVHHESPDRRGIDIAFLFQPEKVELISERAINVSFPFDTATRTRDILFVKVLVLYSDTLNIFINHWPSRWGGEFQTEEKRLFVAKKLKHLSDSIISINPCSKILIMGDLNDTPSNKSLQKGLEVSSTANYLKNGLIDLMISFENKGEGTHYFVGETGGKWSVLDHAIVSSSLIGSCEGLHLKNNEAHIFKPSFLLEKNDNGVMIPFRTFVGMKYNGGFSDHLPIYLDLKLKITE